MYSPTRTQHFTYVVAFLRACPIGQAAQGGTITGTRTFSDLTSATSTEELHTPFCCSGKRCCWVHDRAVSRQWWGWFAARYQGTTWACCCGFSEKEWNDAYLQWKAATQYNSDSDGSIFPNHRPEEFWITVTYLWQMQWNWTHLSQMKFQNIFKIFNQSIFMLGRNVGHRTASRKTCACKLDGIPI